eukprot:36587-Chlamydomonas_euryale.AAC.2
MTCHTQVTCYVDHLDVALQRVTSQRGCGGISCAYCGLGHLTPEDYYHHLPLYHVYAPNIDAVCGGVWGRREARGQATSEKGVRRATGHARGVRLANVWIERGRVKGASLIGLTPIRAESVAPSPGAAGVLVAPSPGAACVLVAPSPGAAGVLVAASPGAVGPTQPWWIESWQGRTCLEQPNSRACRATCHRESSAHHTAGGSRAVVHAAARSWAAMHAALDSSAHRPVARPFLAPSCVLWARGSVAADGEGGPSCPVPSRAAPVPAWSRPLGVAVFSTAP